MPKQPIRNGKTNAAKTPIKSKNKARNTYYKKNPHQKYGTSKLEEDFAREFLDKLCVEYVYQFEAKDIGRFFDFYLPNSNLIIEIDGDYWHGNPEMYNEDELRPHQKRAQRIDEYKTKWALTHSIPILRIWEHDIRKNPIKVMNMLKEILNVQDKKKRIIEDKRKRH